MGGIVAILAAFGIGTAVGSAAGGGDGTTAKASASPSTKGNSPLAADRFPSSSPSPTFSYTPPSYTPKASDFDVKLRITQKQCFGSAGCNVSYKIDVSYSGLPPEDDVEVTYQITGDESGTQIQSFTYSPDGTYNYTSGTASTSSSSVQLSAKVTDVSAS